MPDVVKGKSSRIIWVAIRSIPRVRCHTSTENVNVTTYAKLVSDGLGMELIFKTDFSNVCPPLTLFTSSFMIFLGTTSCKVHRVRMNKRL